MKIGLFMALVLSISACAEDRYHSVPYENFERVGILGHGRGVLGDLQINYYGLERRCDTCHTVSPEAHSALGTCNRCHQPYQSKGWKDSLFAPKHKKVLVLEGKLYHNLACTGCHPQSQSSALFKKAACIHCHNHSPRDIRYAHALMDDPFDMKVENTDQRCVDCHALTGKEYEKFYDPETGYPR
ncbi:hypothetical protein WDW89_09085 [Deltaproteobacteria bacterium TL4]